MRKHQKILVFVVIPCFYSAAFGAVWYAKPSPTGTGDCSSWANACGLNTAVAAATSGDVWVKKGTYQLTEAIRLKNNVRIMGGFNGVETAASQSKPFVNLTILHGGGGLDQDACNDAPLPMVYSKGNNYTAMLRGFVLEDGYGPGWWDINCSGGALLVINSSPTIVNCTFRNNFGWVGGAAAVYGEESIPRFVNCTFHGNGRYLIGTDPQTGEPIYRRNYAGGALAFWLSSAEVVNCLFYDNHSIEGGAVWLHPDCPEISWFHNCTITANEARWGVGSGVAANESQALFVNSIIRGNIGEDVRGPYVVIGYSNVSGGWFPQYGNIDADPLFVNATAHDYRIKYQSPCRNTGRHDYAAWDYGDLDWDGLSDERPSLDLALKTRIVEGQIDMGAYEVSCAAPPVLDCNGNSIPDACDVAEGADCNANGVPDDCDVAADATLDCYNANGVPDSCEAVPKGACCLTSGCQAQQTVCRCTALGGTWAAGSCATACGGGQ